MKNHLPQEKINLLNDAVAVYEQCITECQNLISACAADRADLCLITCNNTDTSECAEHCGKVVKASHKVLVVGQQLLELCKVHIKSCDDQYCLNKCNAVISANDKSMSIARANEELCSVGNEKCVKSCVEFIKQAQETLKYLRS